MNRRNDLKTRHDMAVTEVDRLGNPRHIVVIEDPEPHQIVEVESAPQLPGRPAATSRVVGQVKGSYVDRAQGFSHVTMNLAMVTGFAVLTAGVVLRGEALTLAAVLAYFMSGFFAVWLIAYILHVFVSAEGAEFLEVFMYWRFIRSEQKERYRRMKQTYQYHSAEERRPNLFTLAQIIILLGFAGVLMYQLWGG